MADDFKPMVNNAQWSKKVDKIDMFYDDYRLLIQFSNAYLMMSNMVNTLI